MSGWLRHDDADLAAERILAAADKAFAEVGVSKAGMATVADMAGCSRGTLYRYFKTRHELHLAYIHQVSREIQQRIREALRGVDDPGQRIVESVLCAVREVRSRPGAAAWFEPSVSGATARMSRSAEVVGVFSTAFLAEPSAGAAAGPDSGLRGRWLVRVTLSLLAQPGESEAEERVLVERFVAPALLADSRLARPGA